jgi:dTMP kinase
MNIPALLTHEPGVTPLGRKITRWLKWGKDMGISPMAELMLFNASRAQLVEEIIRPNLKSGRVVICDRYADSTTAYQSYGRGLDLNMVEAVNESAMQGMKPDLTVMLELSVEAGFGRKKGEKRDRFEQEAIDFHCRVRQGYLELAKKEPDRWLVVDAAQSREKIADVIWQKVSYLLSGKS